MIAFHRVATFYLRESTRYLRYGVRLIKRPSIVSIHGVKLPIPDGCPEPHRRSLYCERHERRLALMILAKLVPEDTVLEMGSGRGVLSTLCAKMIGSDRVFTFEANPALIPFIRRVYSLNAVCPHLENVAVGTSEAQVSFYVNARTDSSSLLDSVGKGEEILVRQADVNQLLAVIKPTFLVVDIEGAEGAVLRAAKLDGVRIIALELHKLLGEDGIANLIATITAQGFKEHRWFSTSGRKLFERILR